MLYGLLVHYSITLSKGGHSGVPPLLATTPGEVPTHGDGDFFDTDYGCALLVHLPKTLSESTSISGSISGPREVP